MARTRRKVAIFFLFLLPIALLIPLPLQTYNNKQGTSQFPSTSVKSHSLSTNTTTVLTTITTKSSPTSSPPPPTPASIIKSLISNPNTNALTAVAKNPPSPPSPPSSPLRNKEKKRYLTCYYKFGPNNQLTQLRECLTIALALSRILVIPDYMKTHFQDKHSPLFVPFSSMIDIGVLTRSGKAVTLSAMKSIPTNPTDTLILNKFSSHDPKSKYDAFNIKQYNHSIFAPPKNLKIIRDRGTAAGGFIEFVSNSKQHKNDDVILVFSFKSLRPSSEALALLVSPEFIKNQAALAISSSDKPYACVHIRREEDNLNKCNKRNMPYPKREVLCTTYLKATPTYELFRVLQNIIDYKHVKKLYISSVYPEKYKVFLGEVDFLMQSLGVKSMHLALSDLPKNSTGTDLSRVEQEICINSDIFISSHGSSWSDTVVQSRKNLKKGNVINGSDNSWAKMGVGRDHTVSVYEKSIRKSKSGSGAYKRSVCPAKNENKELTIVTAVNSMSFEGFRGMIASVFNNDRRKDVKVIVYDSGDLSEVQRDEITGYCSGGEIELKSLNGAGTEPLGRARIIQTTLTTVPNFIYVDPSFRFKPGAEIDAKLSSEIAGKGEKYGSGIGVKTKKGGGNVMDHTSADFLGEMGLNGLKEWYKGKKMYAYDLISVDCWVNDEVFELVDEWVAVVERRERDKKANVDANANRNLDESVLNLLLYARYSSNGVLWINGGRDSFDKSEMWNKAAEEVEGEAKEMKERPVVVCGEKEKVVI